MEQIVQTFTLGRSTVVTIPKSLGVRSGVKMHAKKRGKEVIFKTVEHLEKNDIDKLIDKLSGGGNLKENLTPEEINEELDKRYDQMLLGR